jgi:glycosyltransferase involved in cell wall biosynthesis
MDTTPLLSICIPTFNNPGGIREALTSITRQAAGANLLDKIEVCVRDNSENTHTEEVINTFKHSPLKIAYTRNEENVGYDRNVDRVLNMANGDFCWLLSDNEPLLETAVAAVVEAVLKNSDAGHIVIAERKIPESRLRKYKNLEDAIVQNDFWIPGGLVSRNIFKRTYIPKDRSSYFGNYWMHLSLAFKIGKNHAVVFMAEQFGEDLDAVVKWAKNGTTFVTYTNLLQIVSALGSPYSRSFVQTLEGKMRRDLPRHILSAKLYGLLDGADIRKRIRDATNGSIVLYVLSLCALMTPRPLIAYAKQLKHYAHH